MIFPSMYLFCCGFEIFKECICIYSTRFKVSKTDDVVTGVASQGKSIDKALKNFQEAFELWFENAEQWEKERAIKSESVD